MFLLIIRIGARVQYEYCNIIKETSQTYRISHSKLLGLQRISKSKLDNISYCYNDEYYFIKKINEKNIEYTKQLINKIKTEVINIFKKQISRYENKINFYEKCMSEEFSY